MILRTIIFFILLYILIKVLSRFFLPSSDQNRSRSGFFYTHQSDRNSRQGGNRNRDNLKQRLDQIEEAEYEEITDDETEKSSKKSD